MRRLEPKEEAIVMAGLAAIDRRISRGWDGELWSYDIDDLQVVSLVTGPELPANVQAVVYRGGLRIGTLEEGDFHLDLQGAVLAASVSERSAVRLGEKAAQKFLYNRSVPLSDVLMGDKSVRQGDTVIVCDPRGEGIGLATIVAFKDGRQGLEPVHDLGTYLRDQR